MRGRENISGRESVVGKVWLIHSVESLLTKRGNFQDVGRMKVSVQAYSRFDLKVSPSPKQGFEPPHFRSIRQRIKRRLVRGFVLSGQVDITRCWLSVIVQRKHVQGFFHAMCHSKTHLLTSSKFSKRARQQTLSCIWLKEGIDPGQYVGKRGELTFKTSKESYFH